MLKRKTKCLFFKKKKFGGLKDMSPKGFWGIFFQNIKIWSLKFSKLPVISVANGGQDWKEVLKKSRASHLYAQIVHI